jgi:hypothetical protein
MAPPSEPFSFLSYWRRIRPKPLTLLEWLFKLVVRSGEKNLGLCRVSKHPIPRLGMTMNIP